MKKSISTQQENMVADYLGWKTVVASGARDFHKGDVVSSEWLGECKTHIKKVDKISFYLSDYLKIFNEAMSKFKKPILICDDGTQTVKGTYVLISFKHVPDWVYMSFKFHMIFEPSRTNIHIVGKMKDEFDGYIFTKWSDLGQIIILRLEIFRKMIEGEI